MSKSIKVSDQVYEDLRRLHGPFDTHSKVIERLLAIVKPIQEAAEILGPSHYLRGDLSQDSRYLVEVAKAKTR